MNGHETMNLSNRSCGLEPGRFVTVYYLFVACCDPIVLYVDAR